MEPCYQHIDRNDNGRYRLSEMVLSLKSRIKKRMGKVISKVAGKETLERTKALKLRQNEYGFDPFGFQRESLKYVLPVVSWLHRNYFRTQVNGIENVPSSGRVLVIANHSGQLPFDGLMIGAAVFFDATPPRVLRSMIERFVPTVPFVSYLLSRWGQITGTPENCKRLLQNEEAILVFPEGAKGISKPFSQRYQLASFGYGFMRLALETNTPIIPCAVIGAEEQAPAINFKPLAKLLGTPSFPIVPYPPFIPLLPLPTRYHLYFGPQMQFEGDPDDDEAELERKVKSVRNRIQTMIHIGLRDRKGTFR